MKFLLTSALALLAFAGTAGAMVPANGNRPETTLRDSVKVTVSTAASLGTNSALKPMWSYSQEWGRYTQYNKNEALAYAKAEYSFTNGKWASVNLGMALQSSTDANRTMLHEAYLSGKVWKIDWMAGRQAYTPIDQHNDLGIGTYLMSDNAMPTTRVGAGIFDWWSIPYLRDWLQIRGGLYVGMMPNEEGYTQDAILHEKFAYARLGQKQAHFYIGLVHSVMMGGTQPDGTKMPVDFWASFFGKGSKKLLDAGFAGEYYNAAGGHQGLWDLGFDFDFQPLSGSIYYQRPFYDNTAMHLEDFRKCKDITLGMDLKFKHFKPVSEICVEYMTTMWQGGNGPADPIFVSTGPKNTGEVIGLAILEVTPEKIHDYFAQSMIDEWEAEHGTLTTASCPDFLVKYANHGWDWGNRSPYLMNGAYPQGWTVRGLSMGTTLFLTSDTMKAIAPDFDFFNRFSNLRMRALSVGMSGSFIGDRLTYRLKFTGTANYGSYCEQYYSGVDFYKERPNYYFSTRKREYYSGLWLGWNMRHLNVNAALSYDFGEMYKSFSARIGITMPLCVKSVFTR